MSGLLYYLCRKLNVMKWCDYFDYDRVTGNLIWKDRPVSHFKTRRGWRCFGSRFAGKVAGTPHPEGYVQVIVSDSRGVRMPSTLVHRIIYEMHYGPIPDGLDIDHIDCDRSNNRIENLRLATRSQNLWNSATPRGVCSLAGVSFDKRRKKRPYYSRIRHGGKVINLGVFKTEQEAHEAYCRAAKDLHGEFARTTQSPVVQ